MQSWFDQHGYRLACSRLHAAEPLPDIDDFDWLVVMGGPMNVDDESRHAWLAPEKRLIRNAIDSGRHVLGICLGAQLIAQALGARVVPGGPEIGFAPVVLDATADTAAVFSGLDDPLAAFHWHGDHMAGISNAVPLGRSADCAVQGFAWCERVVGLQCHLEITPAGVPSLTRHDPDNAALAGDPGYWADVIADTQRFARMNRQMCGLLERMAALPAV